MSADIKTTSYSIASREQADDLMAEYGAEYGEMRSYHDALSTAQVAFSWRRMPPGTGGRGTYGHSHPAREDLGYPAQEEAYFVISGKVTFKVGADVFEAGPKDAVRIPGDAFRSIHNDTDDEAELLIFSTRQDPPGGEIEEDFWPASQ